MLALPGKKKRTLAGYYFAASTDEAIAYLMTHHGDSQVVGGGTLLMEQVQTGEAYASRLVDVSGVSAMRRLGLSEGVLAIGGAVTFESIAASTDVQDHVPILAQAAADMGNPRVRHLATLAGNLVSGHGNSQCAVALVALEAEVEITNSTGAQWLRAESLFVSPGISRVDSTSELVTGVHVRTFGGPVGGSLVSMARRNGDWQSSYVLALVLGADDMRRQIEWASVVVGSEHVVPTRLLDVDEALSSWSLGEDLSQAGRFADLVLEESLQSGAIRDLAEEDREALLAMARSVWRQAIDQMSIGEQEP